MGGKSAKGNDSVVQFQQQQAAEARQKEAQRQANLEQGKTAIDRLYDGTPVMGTRQAAFDWSGATAPTGTPQQQAMAASGAVSPFGASTANLTGSALPAGFKWIQTAAQPTAPGRGDSAARSPFGNTPEARPGLTPDPSHPGYARAANANVYTGGDSGKDAGGLVWVGNQAGKTSSSAPGGGQVWAVQGPDGKIHYIGDKFNYDQSYDTGQKTGGFGNDFFDKFNQAQLDYYMPALHDQYGEAKDALTYDLARAGTLRSTIADTKNADLVKQNALQEASIKSKADQATGQLRSSILQDKKSLLDQLYATEDPGLASNAATSAVNAAKMTQPDLSPLAKVFDLGTIGQSGYSSAYDRGFTAGGIGAQSPNRSTGKPVYG